MKDWAQKIKAFTYLAMEEFLSVQTFYALNNN